MANQSTCQRSPRCRALVLQAMLATATLLALRTPLTTTAFQAPRQHFSLLLSRRYSHKSKRSCLHVVSVNNEQEETNSLVDTPRVDNGNKQMVQQSQQQNQTSDVMLTSVNTTMMMSPTTSAATSSSSSSLDMESKEKQNREKLFMLGLLWITAFLAALDRVSMSVALVPMATEFGLTDTVKGSISSFFSVGYSMSILPAGILLSFASPRLVMSAAVVAWSLATLATPLAAQGLTPGGTATLFLLGMRASVGAAESLVMPTLQRLLSTWTAPDEKGFGIAAVVTGFQTGTVSAYLLSPVIMDVFGSEGVDAWRELFLIYGAFGMALLLPWYFWAKDEPSIPLVAPAVVATEPDTPTSGSMITTSAESSTTTEARHQQENTSTSFQDAVQVFKDAPWGDFLRSRGSWAILLTHGAKSLYVTTTLWRQIFARTKKQSARVLRSDDDSLFVSLSCSLLYNVLAWTPTFYDEQYGIAVRDSAWLSVFPCIAGAVGALLSGTIGDGLVRRQQEANGGVINVEQLTNIRKGFQAIALYGPALALGALAWDIPEDPIVAQGYLVAAMGLHSFIAAGFEAAIQDKAGPKWAGLLYSATSLPAVTFGTFGVFCMGKVLDASGQDWSLVWGINAAITALGATAFVAMYDAKREFE